MTAERISEEAAAWLVRQQGDAMDWEAFTVWLEADPQHRSAFDELALLDRALTENADRVFPSTTDAEPESTYGSTHRHWGRLAGVGGGLIAATVAGLLWLQPLNHQDAIRDYRSGPGQILQVALGDGGEIAIAPISHLRVQGNKIDVQGSAFFDIPHRPGRILNVNASDFTVADIGTRFAVENEADAVTIGVAQGSVRVTSNRLATPISLSSGHALVADRSGSTIRLAAIKPQQVADWRTGKLEFDNAPLALVARRISRYSGEDVTVDPEIASLPFSGVIAINHGEVPAQILAQILSLDVETVGKTHRLRPRRK